MRIHIYGTPVVNEPTRNIDRDDDRSNGLTVSTADTKGLTVKTDSPGSSDHQPA
jgi:hypothetical protein